MADQYLYNSNELIERARKKETAFGEIWMDRAQEFVNASMPESAKKASELVKDAKGVSMILEDTLEANKALLKQDQKLDAEYDKIKEREQKEKMYA